MKPYIPFLILFLFFSNYILAQDVILPDNIPPATQKQLEHFLFIKNNQMGVAGNDFAGTGERVINCTVPYHDPPVGGGPWFPINGGYKKTLCGNLMDKIEKVKTKEEDDNGDEDFYGWITPSASYQYLLTESLHPNDYSNSHEPFYTWTGGAYTYKVETFHSGTIHFEINFMNKEVEDDIVDKKSFFPIDNNTCVYGVWCDDDYHGGWTEIHPIQQMWQTNILLDDITHYQLLFARDNSGRYESQDDYENCNDESDFWVSDPLMNNYYIAFEIPLSTAQGISYLMTESYASGLHPLAAANQTTCRLVYKNKVLISFTAPNNNYAITFTDIAKTPQNTLIGYVKLSAMIDQPFPFDAITNRGPCAICEVVKMKNTSIKDYIEQDVFHLSGVKILHIKSTPSEHTTIFQRLTRKQNALFTITDGSDSVSVILNLKETGFQDFGEISFKTNHFVDRDKNLSATMYSQNSSSDNATIILLDDIDGVGFGHNDFNGTSQTRKVILHIKNNITLEETEYLLEITFNVSKFISPADAISPPHLPDTLDH